MESTVIDFLASRIHAAASAGFAMVADVPSDEVRQSLARLESLSQLQREQYFRWVARRNSSYWGFKSYSPSDSSPELTAFCNAPCAPAHSGTAETSLASRSSVRKETRAAIFAYFGARHAHSPEPNEDLYSFSCLGEAVVLSVHYGGRTSQLRYAVRIPGQIDGLNFNIEVFYGLGLGWWSLIEQVNIESLLSMLPRCIELIVQEHQLVKRVISMEQGENGT